MSATTIACTGKSAESDGHAAIRGVVVQGRLDLESLLGTPWKLAHSWPGCELVFVDETGHGGRVAMTAGLVAATDSF
jgi:proline iminopeptidase